MRHRVGRKTPTRKLGHRVLSEGGKNSNLFVWVSCVFPREIIFEDVA